jgi:hypothetical protein
MINYHKLKNWSFEEIRYTYSTRDTILYALGIGIGADPLDVDQLRFTYESPLESVPTMATVVGSPGFFWGDERTGVDPVKVVHGEQRLEVFRPLPTHGTVIARNRIDSLTDKGLNKGALAVTSRDIIDESSGDLLARGTSVSFLRADGGFSAADGISDPAPVALPKPPVRSPDVQLELASIPAVAKTAGFPRPILHGLCTYGMTCHAVMRACLQYEARRLKSLSLRFTGPVYPGDVLRFELWREESAKVWNIRAHVDSRDIMVLDYGIAEIM